VETENREQKRKHRAIVPKLLIRQPGIPLLIG
jgi:hypothetical protein